MKQSAKSMKALAEAKEKVELIPEANLEAWPSLDGRPIEIHVYKAQQQAEVRRIEEANARMEATQ
jgi:hypothetical protein